MELDDLFRAHEREVFAYFLRLVPRRADAEDLTQETFTRACSAALRYRGDASLRTWLFGIARRVLLESSRRGLFRREVEVPLEVPEAERDHDARLDLEAAFQQLSLHDKEVLMLVDVLGFAPSDGATMIGITPEAFRVRLHRARGRLREHLRDG